MFDLLPDAGYMDAVLAARAELEKKKTALAETSFREFIRLSWPVVEPGSTFVPNWHIDCIADHMQAAYEGKIRKLLVNVPPRSMKSTICAVMFPAWVWISQPQKKFLFSSYDLKLSKRHSRICRDLIKSQWYQRHWADRFSISKIQDAKERFDNSEKGFRMATAVDAGTTGDGGDFLCLPGDEFVWTEYGKVRIEDIVALKIDCRAWSYNTDSGAVELKPIKGWFHNPPSRILEIKFNDGAVLRCTPNHKVWTSNRGWVQAQHVLLEDVFPCPAFSDQVNHVFVDPKVGSDGGMAFGRAEDSQNGVLGQLNHPASSTIGAMTDAFGGDAPGSALTDAVDSGAADAVSRGQDGAGFQAGGDFGSGLPVEDRTGPFLKERHGPVPDGISDVLSPGSVFQVGEPGIGPVAVTVSDLLALRAFAAKGEHNEAMNVPHHGPSILAETKAGVPVRERGLHDPALDGRHGAIGGPSSESRLTADTAKIGHTVDACISGQRKPVLIREAGFATDTYCIEVADNHTFLVGRKHSTIVANCYDDLNNPREMTSEAYIEGVIHYHDYVMASRLNDPKTGVRISIQQRCGERDITGHILAKEQEWEVIVIPNEYEGKRKATVLGWEDPRTEYGELFWPDRIGIKETEDLKKKGSYPGQYQQRPAAAEGAKFKREWWRFYNPAGVNAGDVHLETSPGKFIDHTPVTLPSAFEQVVQGWDMAFKDGKENDLVAGHAWGRIGSNCFLLSRKSGHWDFPETLRQVRDMSVKFPCPEKMIENKANGPAVIQSLRNEIPGLIESPVDGGLLALANSTTGYVEAGNIFLPNPELYPWVRELIDQFASYPSGAHDDDIAAACHALRRLYDSAANSGLPEFRVLPRLGEPESASHIIPDGQMAETLEPHWKRWIAVSPGQHGSAVWLCETAAKSIRIYRELSLAGLDAQTTGRKIAELTLPDIRAYQKTVHLTAKWSIEVLMEKELFAPIESVGCYAELVEAGIASYKPDFEEWKDRSAAERELGMARFIPEMVSLEDSAYDRLRELLRFAPPGFRELSYDRKKAIELSRTDDAAYQKYMAAVDGKVYGEWPKIKVSESCKETIRALGSSRREDGAANHFLRAVLLGMAAPPGVPQKSRLELKAPTDMSTRTIRGFGRRGRRIA